ncbi:MAG: flagellar brake protein [gamma proteobacterium symbiont of Taylorina sp.]|nr:flagellar brake protein [gamma proteobacterium symbiont of Taylorina sp.]
MSFPFNLFSFLSSPKTEKKTAEKIIQSEESISALLKNLQNHLVIITANFPGETKNFSTSIIKMDYQNKKFYLDELLPYEGNSHLNKLKQVQLRTHIDSCILSMKCRLIKQDEEKGLLYSVMHFPDTIISVQNREFHRVNIPLNKHLKVVLKTVDGEFITGSLNDLSYNGMSLRFKTPPALNIEKHDIIPFTTIYLNDVVISCKMEIKRIFSISDNTIIAGLLEEVTTSQQQTIQKFIAHLDRLKRRNRELN